MKSRSKPDENEGLIPETTDKNKTSIKWEEFVAGAGGGALNVAFTYPIHKLMFRQVNNYKTQNVFLSINDDII